MTEKPFKLYFDFDKMMFFRIVFVLYFQTLSSHSLMTCIATGNGICIELIKL